MKKEFIMKSIFFIIISLFLLNPAFSQNKHNDVIYPVSGNDSITDCHIIKIKGWNTIIFEKDDFQDTVLAIAAVKNGKFIDFRTRKEIKNNAYPEIFSFTNEKDVYKGEEYYRLQYRQAKKQKKGGATLTLIGLFTGITSYVIINNNNKKYKPTRSFVTATYIGSAVLFNIGVPIWISGGINEKRSEKAMLYHQRKDISVNLGITNNGIGIALGF